jgi:hypothetical protein
MLQLHAVLRLDAAIILACRFRHFFILDFTLFRFGRLMNMGLELSVFVQL